MVRRHRRSSNNSNSSSRWKTRARMAREPVLQESPGLPALCSCVILARVSQVPALYYTKFLCGSLSLHFAPLPFPLNKPI